MCLKYLHVKEDDIYLMIDDSYEDILTVYSTEVLNSAKYFGSRYEPDKKTKKERQIGTFIIYFSGHGKLIDGQTVGVDCNGDNIPIEEFVN